MADKVFPKGKLKKCPFPLFIVILIFGVITIVGLVTYKQRLIPIWKTYENLEFGYEIQYPSSWYLKEEYRFSFRSLCAKDDNCLEKLYIVNRKEEVLMGDESLAKNGSAFCIRIFGLSPDVLSIKQWIEESTNKAPWPDEVKQEVRQRELNSVTTMEVGGAKRETLVEVEPGSTHVRVEFVDADRLYGIRYESGNRKQFEKDLDIFEKMLASFKIK